MKLLGLIGYPLTHSFSVSYFSEKFKRENISGWEYRNFPLKRISDVNILIRNNPELCGLNITIPYKEQIISYLDKLDPVPRRIGAVNTVKIIRKGSRHVLVGYNTDCYGFLKSLTPSLNSSHKRALILGTGGASKAVAFVLQELEIEYLFVTRNPKPGMITYRDLCLSMIRNHLLIVNTTPLGTFPDVHTFPDIPYDLLTPDHLLYDLVYNPPETEFLRLGRQKGATCINGQKMLELQAEKSWEIFTL